MNAVGATLLFVAIGRDFVTHRIGSQSSHPRQPAVHMLHSIPAGATPAPERGAEMRSSCRIRQPGGRALAALLLAVACALVFRSADTPALFWVLKPTAQCRVGSEGVEVIVHFSEERPVELSSFRVLLNDADVTPELIQGSNGATGQLFGLLDGVNRLHFELRALAEPGLEGRLESRDRTCLVRGPLELLRG